MTRFDKARRWRVALTLAAVPAFLLATPGVSNAALRPSPGFLTAQTWIIPPGALLTQFPGLFDVGDCELDGSDTWATLQRPTADNGYTSFVSWHALGQTFHTNNADIWHNTFHFLDHLGNTIFSVGPLSGSRMDTVRHPYEWTGNSHAFPLDPAVFNQIVYVEWEGAC